MMFWLIADIIKILIVFAGLLGAAAYLTLLERKIAARIQNRMGPMEAGFHGLLQPIADGIKLFFKEDIIPAGANKFLFLLAPIIVVIPALTTFAVIPFGAPVKIMGHTVPLQITDVNIGILFILALTSLGSLRSSVGRLGFQQQIFPARRNKNRRADDKLRSRPCSFYRGHNNDCGRFKPCENSFRTVAYVVYSVSAGGVYNLSYSIYRGNEQGSF
jgi:NADH dehydrogenase subunit H (EC 1.6.5.3)